jgi:hypothetical protein
MDETLRTSLVGTDSVIQDSPKDTPVHTQRNYDIGSCLVRLEFIRPKLYNWPTRRDGTLKYIDQLPWGIKYNQDSLVTIRNTQTVDGLLGISHEHQAAALDTLDKAFTTASAHDGCVISQTVDELKASVNKSQHLELTLYEKTPHLYGVDDDKLLLVKPDPQNPNQRLVIDLDKWSSQSPDEVRTMLLEYLEHEIIDLTAHEAAKILGFHQLLSQPDTIPPIVQKAALISSRDVHHARLVELNEYLLLLEQHPAHFRYFRSEWRSTIQKVIKLRVGDQEFTLDVGDWLRKVVDCETTHLENNRLLAHAQLQAYNNVLNTLREPTPTTTGSPQEPDLTQLLTQFDLTLDAYHELIRPLTRKSIKDRNYTTVSDTVLPLFQLAATGTADASAPDTLLGEAFLRCWPDKPKTAKEIFLKLQQIIKAHKERKAASPTPNS